MPIAHLSATVSRSAEASHLTLFCPAVAGLAAHAIEAVSLLPIHDCNGRLLQAIAGGARGAEGVSACVFTIDPFRRYADLFAALREAGFSRVTNFPSTAVIDGEMRDSLEELGFGSGREECFLREAAEAGFNVTAFVTTAEGAQDMLAAGASSLVTPAQFVKQVAPAIASSLLYELKWDGRRRRREEA